jgi:hypothetical protein
MNVWNAFNISKDITAYINSSHCALLKKQIHLELNKETTYTLKKNGLSQRIKSLLQLKREDPNPHINSSKQGTTVLLFA